MRDIGSPRNHRSDHLSWRKVQTTTHRTNRQKRKALDHSSNGVPDGASAQFWLSKAPHERLSLFVSPRLDKVVRVRVRESLLEDLREQLIGGKEQGKSALPRAQGNSLMTNA